MIEMAAGAIAKAWRDASKRNQMVALAMAF
jgi:hypothetical protein